MLNKTFCFKFATNYIFRYIQDIFAVRKIWYMYFFVLTEDAELESKINNY